MHINGAVAGLTAAVLAVPLSLAAISPAVARTSAGMTASPAAYPPGRVMPGHPGAARAPGAGVTSVVPLPVTSVMNLSGTISWTATYTDPNIPGDTFDDVLAGSFTINLTQLPGRTPVNHSTYSLSDHYNDVYNDGAGCITTTTGTADKTGALPYKATGNRLLYYYTGFPSGVPPGLDMTIRVPYKVPVTATQSGSEQGCTGTTTYTIGSSATPGCYYQSDLTGWVGVNYTGTYPNGVFNLACSGSTVDEDNGGYTVDYSVTGELQVCQNGLSKPELAVCIADQAVAGLPLPEWGGGPIPYSWGGGHDDLPGPTLGTCIGYSGPHSKTLKDCEDYLGGPTHTVGLDCAGFTRWVYELAYGQDVLGAGVVNSQRINPEVTPDTEATPALGDLVFYQDKNKKGVLEWDHEGILIAPGEIAVEPHTGAFLKAQTVTAPGTPHYYTYNGA
jgi:hypothetical protein